MPDTLSKKLANDRYEEKRKGDPRFGGYLTEDEKQLFTRAKKFGGFKSEKEMLIFAVKHYLSE